MDFNDQDAQDALNKFIDIQESEYRLEIGPINEVADPATPAPAMKGSPRFPGHLTMYACYLSLFPKPG